MPASNAPILLTPSKSSSLKSHLLGGASLSVMVLAASFAVTGSAMAQVVTKEIEGATGSATALFTGDAVISGATGGQFGAINTDEGGQSPDSITLTQSETIRVFDSIGGGESSSVNNDFVIDQSATGTLIFAEDIGGAGSNDAILFVNGNLAGDDATIPTVRGGMLDVSVRDGVAQDDSGFVVYGSTLMTAITVGAGNADSTADGGDIATRFGDVNDTFDSTGLTVNGGNANAAFSGGSALMEINSDTGAGIVTIGADGISVKGGDAGAGAGSGGFSDLNIYDDATIAGAVTVTGGNQGTGAGSGGSAILRFAFAAGTVNLTEALMITSGSATAGATAAAGSAEALFSSTTVNAMGGIVLTEYADSGGAFAALTLYGTGDQTVSGAITAANDGDGNILVKNSGGAGTTVVFNDAIGAQGARIGSLYLAGNTTINMGTVAFHSDVHAEDLFIGDGVTAVFKGANSVLDSISGTETDGDQSRTINVGDGTTAATLQVNGNVGSDAGDANTISSIGLFDMSTFVVDASDDFDDTVIWSLIYANSISDTVAIKTTGDSAVYFAEDVGVGHGIDSFDFQAADSIFEGNVTGGDVMVAAGSRLILRGAVSTFTGNVTGEGTLNVGNSTAESLSFEGTESQSVDIAITGGGSITTNNTSDEGVIFNNTIGESGDSVGAVNISGNATFNGEVHARSFTSTTGVGLSFNNSAAPGTPFVVMFQDALVIGGGNTINLGSNVGDGDVVFQLTNTGANFVANGIVPGDIAIKVSSGFTSGTITLVDDDVDISGEAPDFAVADTALTDFELVTANEGEDLTITATANSTAQVAATLGITAEEAAALQQAAQSGDLTLVDLLTDILNDATNPTAAALAAQQVGAQGEQVGAGAGVGVQLAGQQQGITSSRIARLRSNDRFASAFGETGFSGGDLADPAAAGPSLMNSFWFQAYGGMANADGNNGNAGYDAGFGGGLVGIDGMISEEVVIGAFGGYSMASVDGDGAGNAQLDINAYQIGVYGSYTGASFYLEGFAAYAMGENDTTRTALGNTLTGNFDSDQYTLSLSGGVPVEVGEGVFMTPNASLTLNTYDADGYTEVGVGANTVSSVSATQLTGTVGARIHAVFNNIDDAGTILIPEVRLGVSYDLIDDDAVATARFAGGGAAFNVSGTDISDVGALVGVGLSLDNEAWSAGLSYDGDLRSDFMSHTARADIRLKF